MSTILDLASEQHKVGVIFSRADKYTYTVQILENGEISTVCSWNKPKVFESIDDAKDSLRTNHVDEAYIALDNTYDEFGSHEIEDHQSDAEQRYSFMPIALTEEE